MRVLSHDGFGRTSVVRRTNTGHTVDAGGGYGDRLYSCAWCGTVRRTSRGKPFAYQYGTQPDTLHGRVQWETHTFCCKSCRDAFHC